MVHIRIWEEYAEIKAWNEKHPQNKTLRRPRFLQIIQIFSKHYKLLAKHYFWNMTPWWLKPESITKICYNNWSSETTRHSSFYFLKTSIHIKVLEVNLWLRPLWKSIHFHFFWYHFKQDCVVKVLKKQIFGIESKNTELWTCTYIYIVFFMVVLRPRDTHTHLTHRRDNIVKYLFFSKKKCYVTIKKLLLLPYSSVISVVHILMLLY